MTAALIGGLGLSTWMFLREKEARQRAVLAEQRTMTEARKSQQVAQFLTDMLNGVGPSVALGRDTTILKEILDKTAERVGKELQDQPAVEAELRSTIGEIYRAVGDYAQAEAMHRAALAIRRKLFGHEHPDVALALSCSDHDRNPQPITTRSMKLQISPSIAIMLVALAAPGRSADAPIELAAKAPEISRVTLRYFGGVPVHAAHQVGDWMETRRSMRYRYEGGTRIAYEQEGARTFVRIDDAPRRLAGIAFASAGGSEALREAIAEDARSFVIRCPAASLPELPPLPQGRDLGLAVDDALSDLAVLEKYSQLSALNVRLAGSPGLAPLRSLSSLTTLEIESAPGDITPLAGLRRLAYLKLNRPDQNVDFSPLAALPELRSLELIMPRLPDLTAIGELSQLTSLRLFNGLFESSGVTNLDPIGRLTGLRRLELRNIGRETDLTPLARLTKLTHLSLEDFPAAANPRALGGLRDLKELSLHGLPLADADLLNDLTKLEYLSLRSCRALHDLAPVWKLSNLKQLWLADLKGLKSDLAGNALDLRLLNRLRKLEALTLFLENGVGDLSPLANLPELWHLRFSEGSASTNPAQLANMKKLTALGPGVKGKSLDLDAMPRITSLELYGSDLADLSCISRLRNLEALHLVTPQISDLRPLSNVPKLKSLFIMNSPVTDLAPLAGLAELRDLQVWMCRGIASVEPLSKLPNLMIVDIEGYNKVDLSPLRAMERRGGEVFLDSVSKRLKRQFP